MSDHQAKENLTSFRFLRVRLSSNSFTLTVFLAQMMKKRRQNGLSVSRGGCHGHFFYKELDRLCLNVKEQGTLSQMYLPSRYSSPQHGEVFRDNGKRAGEATGASVPARGPGTALAYSLEVSRTT